MTWANWDPRLELFVLRCVFLFTTTCFAKEHSAALSRAAEWGPKVRHSPRKATKTRHQLSPIVGDPRTRQGKVTLSFEWVVPACLPLPDPITHCAWSKSNRFFLSFYCLMHSPLRGRILVLNMSVLGAKTLSHFGINPSYPDYGINQFTCT